MDDSLLKRERYWKTIFSEAAHKYESDDQISLWTEQGLYRRVEACLRILEKHLTGVERILDAGCGPGTYCRILAERGYSVVGLDYSEPGIRKAIEKSEGKHIRYSIGDIYSLPFKDSSFDTVICVGAFQYITNEEEAVIELRRILRNKPGLLVLITLNSLSVKALYDKIATSLFRNNKGENSRSVYSRKYNPFKFESLLKQKGFKRVRFQGVYILPKYARFLEGVFDKLNTKFSIPFLMAAHAFVIVASIGEGREQ
jgi:ubiquinone/menaquinone biosynthesis C-methylase UbiE